MRLHICHVIESLEFGGAEKVVVDLANASVADHDITVCCLKREGQLRADLAAQIPVICLHKTEGNDYRLPARLAAELRARKVDVVHTHNWGTFVEGTIAARLANAKALHSVHGSYAPVASGLVAHVKRRVRHAAERVVAHWCERIVTVSHSIARDIQHDMGLPADRIQTIHNGIALAAVVPPSKNPAGVHFISVGRLVAVKNHAMMLRAFAQLNDRAELTLVGDGPERRALERLAQELGIAARVRFLGFRQDIPLLLSQADVFLVSSHYEGISIAVLEAMRASLAVVATTVGGVPETVIDGKTGLLVAANDEAALAAAMQRMFDPILRARLGGNGYEYLQREFSLDAMTDAYAVLYRRYAGNRGHRTVRAL